MPNTFAYIVLFGWPVLVAGLFRIVPPAKAIAISIVFGYLFLPTQASVDLPLLPEYDRALAASLPALLMALIMTPSRALRRQEQDPGARDHVRPGWLPQQGLVRFCVIALVIGPFVTVLMNGDPLQYGEPGHPRFDITYLPGLRPYDGAAAVLGALMALLPFLLARKYLSHPREQMMLLGVLFVAALVYSLPTLWEIRMSPQLNRQIYGFFPHSWLQHIRGGGFRPLVFLEHGLRLGIFLALAILAGANYVRARNEAKVPMYLAIFWLCATLVFSKTLGAFLIVVLLLPIAILLSARMQILVAAIVAATVLTYPMTRAAGVFPVDTIMNVISSVGSSERLDSLSYRFANEDILLDKADDRPIFGWGGWGRARVYDEYGRDISTTDGRWIIEFGEYGWVGYLATFGLLTLPIVLLAFRRNREDVTLVSSGLAIALAANLLDLLPNSALTPLTWLMAGALAGRLETATVTEPDTKTTAEPARHMPYRRFGPPVAGSASMRSHPVHRAYARRHGEGRP